MDGLEQNVFGPLGQQYCLYFYALSVMAFVIMCILGISVIAFGIKKQKGLDYYTSALFGLLAYGIFYFQNRLLYTMCQSAISA
jgi:hypothetical protein|tara:strand:+ start:447 stop:695 length:249 start_codon:yes stop_codon:yes gene_type:complete